MNRPSGCDHLVPFEASSATSMIYWLIQAIKRETLVVGNRNEVEGSCKDITWLGMLRILFIVFI